MVELYIIRFHPCDLAFLYLMFSVAINGADGLGLGLDVPLYRHVVTEIVFLVTIGWVVREVLLSYTKSSQIPEVHCRIVTAWFGYNPMYKYLFLRT